MTGRPADWQPLAAGDPIPGHPEQLVSLAGQLTTRAHGLDRIAAQVKALQPGSLWTGLAALAYDEHRAELPPRLAEMGRRQVEAARAVQAYAHELSAAQATSLRALAEAKDAERRRVAAGNGLRAIQGTPAAAQQARIYQARLADAEGDLAHARHLLGQAVQQRDDGAQRAAKTVVGLQFDEQTRRGLGIGTGQAETLRRLLDPDKPFGDPAAFRFVMTRDGLVLNAKAGWQYEAYRQAGIDPARWIPANGLPFNDESARKAWEFYARLFDGDPRHFLWASMAKLAGGSFYAGFQDINVLRRAIDSGADPVVIKAAIDAMMPTVPPPVRDELVREIVAAGKDAAKDLAFVETRFLQMQKDIFDDLAWQHVAYANGGITALENVPRTDMPAKVLAAWHDIDSGDPARIAAGNRELLYREQHDTIQANYDRIRDHSTITHALTIGMSVMAESPVPGGRPMRDYMTNVPVVTPGVEIKHPFGVPVPVPGVDVHHIPIPDKNVSVFADRWEWIDGDMLPTYLKDLRQDPAGTRRAIDTPIEQYGRDKRMVPNVWPFRYP